MGNFSIESNGRIQNTAIYYNGEQLGGVREILLNLDEDGTFDAVIQYEGSDRVLYTKKLFVDYLEKIRTTEPAFTEEEAAGLNLLTVESNGDIEETVVLMNDAPLEGLVSLLIQIKGGSGGSHSGGLRALFSGKEAQPSEELFRVEATFRNEDDSLSTENLF